MSDAVLDLRDLRRSYAQGGESIDVLKGINLTICPGEIVGLLGPSGAGKSTLLQAAGQLEGGYQGQIIISGQDCGRLGEGDRTKMRRDKIGFVYQFHHLLPDFTALENVQFPLLVRNISSSKASSAAKDMLSRLGLAKRLKHRPAELSGGEQQRGAIARALVSKPALLLADEPTGNLDEATADIVFNELIALTREQNTSALIATHNPSLAERMDRRVFLHDGLLGAS
ncbi:MAG: ABC transporter ATP-binding protein [Sphingomonadales bacterium]